MGTYHARNQMILYRIAYTTSKEFEMLCVDRGINKNTFFSIPLSSEWLLYWNTFQLICIWLSSQTQFQAKRWKQKSLKRSAKNCTATWHVKQYDRLNYARLFIRLHLALTISFFSLSRCRFIFRSLYLLSVAFGARWLQIWFSDMRSSLYSVTRFPIKFYSNKKQKTIYIFIFSSSNFYITNILVHRWMSAVGNGVWYVV